MSIDLIQNKLDRVRAYVIKTYESAGRLNPAHQRVIRIIDSRKRELQRILLVKTRPADDPDRKQAEIELNVQHKDIGELFRWRLLNHAYGRLGCPGCSYDYKTDPVMGLPVKMIFSRLCPICGQGIQHSASADTAQEAQEAVLGFWEAVGANPGTAALPGADVCDDGSVLIYMCDACFGWMVERC